MTLADATTEQKRAVSHRGRAFDALHRDAARARACSREWTRDVRCVLSGS